MGYYFSDEYLDARIRYDKEKKLIKSHRKVSVKDQVSDSIYDSRDDDDGCAKYAKYASHGIPDYAYRGGPRIRRPGDVGWNPASDNW